MGYEFFRFTSVYVATNADVFLVVPFLHPEVRKATTGNTSALAGYGVRTWELFLCLAPFFVFVFFLVLLS